MNFVFDSRYILGTFYETTHFQLLSGLYVGRQKEIYAALFIAVNLVISAAASFCALIKIIKERYKDKKLLRQINVQITNPPAKFQYNNVKSNVSIMNGYEMILTVGIVFSTSLVLLVHVFSGQDENNQYWVKTNYLELATSMIYKVIIPITYLVKRRDMRNFIWNEIFN